MQVDKQFMENNQNKENTDAIKIFSAGQIKKLDLITIEEEPISSLDLMERAAGKFSNFVLPYTTKATEVVIFCGPGNNGGDGLVVARLLHLKKTKVTVYWCKISSKVSPEFEENYNRLLWLKSISIIPIEENGSFPEIEKDALIIDAILGSGLSRSVEGYWGKLIDFINGQGKWRFSIDIPSGMFPDEPTEGTSIHANYTYTFELPKLAFFFPENADRLGQWEVGKIGLLPSGIERLTTENYQLTALMVAKRIRKRGKFDHKGKWGHALLVAGSKGMMGAAVLAAKASLRSGPGLLSLYIPGCGYDIIQSAAPEALAISDPIPERITKLDSLSLEKYSAIGIGCGIGTANITAKTVATFLEKMSKPLVIDADALNIIAEKPSLLDHIPAGSILTPHPGEFDRLFEFKGNSFERLKKLRVKAVEHSLYIVLKGAYSCLATPDGNCYFNNTGNPGMATGGSGDVLTGIITGLLAQGYSSFDAAIIGVWIHGLAGDLAATEWGYESLTAGDIIKYIGNAFKNLHQIQQK